MSGISAYQENQVVTQSQGKIIVLLYEGAIRFLRQASEHIQAGRMAEKGQMLNKANAIITELMCCLDMEAGGEISRNLRSLYVYMNGQIIKANVACDVQKIEEVVGLLEELLEGWRSICD